MTLPATLQNRLSLPVIGSPLFIISGPELVLAQCKAGIVGSFPALNARPQPLLEDWLRRITTDLDAWRAAHPGARVAPFAVNQIIHGSNDRLAQDMELCVRYRVPIIITSLRAPDELVEPVHSYGGLIFHDVTSIRHARRAIQAGVDGLILVCAGAGGHAGTLSPFAFLEEIRQFYDGTVILGGSLTTGRSIYAALAAGADLAYVGTRFIATREANAMPEYKQMLVDSTADDIVYTNLFTGVHGNYLKPSITGAGLDPNNLPASDKSRMNWAEFASPGKKAWRDIWGAGQGVGAITSVPATAELIASMRREYEAAHRALAGKLERECYLALAS
jgi:nitronate monooxygenase